MLTQLTIRNFAIVDNLTLDLKSGMTAISGETGAGKSIMLDALGLTLGDRADSGSVRMGEDRAEITACFDISALDQAKDWLMDHDLDQDDECIIRRIITREGRSRSYINGQACPISSLKSLGEHLIAIHGQHEHQQLLKKDHHRTLLDQYAGSQDQAAFAKLAYKKWQSAAARLDALKNQSDEQTAKVQLLSYQVEELDNLSLQEGELEALEAEQKQLSQADTILHNGHQVLSITTEGEQDNCLQLINLAIQKISELPVHITTTQINEMLTGAQIQIEEASQELRHYLDRVEVNPARQEEVEERLSTIFDLSRKHRVNPDELIDLHVSLAAELDQLNFSDEALEALTHEVEAHFNEYQLLAGKLSKARNKAAKTLNKSIDEQLHHLGMGAASFVASLTETSSPQPYGSEEVEFLISTNKGQPHRPLAKIASGGELSRISLAIQVVTAQTSTTPSLIFDEVDVGIGGGVAEVVGRMLRKLGERAQVMCVTHQPQVASQAHQHLFVSKQNAADKTHTQIEQLEKDQRVQEIARMLGGIDITQRSIDHAKEMLGL